MKNYIIKLQDKFINDKYVKSLLFTQAVFKASSCKKVAIQLKSLLKADDYELKYFKSMDLFVLRLVYTRTGKFTIVTYYIYNMK
jgi:hypothetical protein